MHCLIVFSVRLGISSPAYFHIFRSSFHRFCKSARLPSTCSSFIHTLPLSFHFIIYHRPFIVFVLCSEIYRLPLRITVAISLPLSPITILCPIALLSPVYPLSSHSALLSLISLLSFSPLSSRLLFLLLLFASLSVSSPSHSITQSPLSSPSVYPSLFLSNLSFTLSNLLPLCVLRDVDLLYYEFFLYTLYGCLIASY